MEISHRNYLIHEEEQGERLFFYWYANQASPLSPRAVVVSHFGVAQQVVKHEPGMTAPLTDTALGYNFFVCSHSFAFVERTQLISRLESAIFTYCLCPGNVGCPWDMTASLCAFLWQVCGSQQLSAIFSRRANIDQCDVAAAQLCEDLVAQCPYSSVR